MIRNYVFIFGMLLLVGCMPFQGGDFSFDQDSKTGEFEEQKFVLSGPQKGVVLNFRAGQPSNPIIGPFSTTVEISNYLDDFVTYNLDVYDSTSLEGFDSVKDIQGNIGPAIYDGDRFYQPQREVYSMDSTVYSGVRDGSETQFIAKVKYEVNSDAEINFCVTGSGGSQRDCSSTQTLSGSSMGEANYRSPVLIKNVKKTIGSENTEGFATMMLEISIEDDGKGKVWNIFDDNFREEIIKFNIIPLYGVDEFRCSSDNSVSQIGRHDLSGIDLPMKVRLEKGRAKVVCQSEVMVDETINNIKSILNLNYGYEYQTETDLIDVRAGN